MHLKPNQPEKLEGIPKTPKFLFCAKDMLSLCLVQCSFPIEKGEGAQLLNNS